ncbi:MAG: peptide chain release factor 2 [Gammaproteobacteria bacterium]
MMEPNQINAMISDLQGRCNALRGYLDYDGKRERLEEVGKELENPDVWGDPDRAQALGKERASLEAVVETLDRIHRVLDESQELFSLAEEEQDSGTLADIAAEVTKVNGEIEKLEFRRMFAGEMDQHNAYLDIQSGSGGTEAQDWADMLLRMYLRWAESRGFGAEILELSPGEIAGIKSATVLFSGDCAFGWLRTETGVHRLVRKSPFDAGHRRHTSFAAVFVSPELEDDIAIEIDPGDLRVDLYRASGAGGQHVNKTESAVRLTHLPSGIVVQCQNDRSQHKNRATAMGQLKAKLYEREQQKRREEIDALENSKADIGWGSQIRSYVLDQSRIKDLRTGLESSNPSAVLDGAIDRFLEESLKQGL